MLLANTGMCVNDTNIVVTVTMCNNTQETIPNQNKTKTELFQRTVYTLNNVLIIICHQTSLSKFKKMTHMIHVTVARTLVESPSNTECQYSTVQDNRK